MSRAESAIFTVLCMVIDENGNLLVQNRIDPDWPGICFPGGHVEKGESFTRAAIREVWEETGLIMEDPRLCGVKQFQTKNDDRYVVFFYKSTKFHGTLTSSEEGMVFWVSRSDLIKHPMVSDMLSMLKVFDEDDLNEFYYHQKDDVWELSLL